jgi:hypothetical protein
MADPDEGGFILKDAELILPILIVLSRPEANFIVRVWAFSG